MGVTDQIRSDIKASMKAHDRDRTTALRTLLAALETEAKQGKSDGLDAQGEIAVLQRERKRRIEAAEAYEQGGSHDRAAAERSEASLIDGYLPAQLADDELARLVSEAVAQTGASGPREMGKVMSAVMPKVQGRADGRRVSAVVREKLGA